jgi:hypothetical protein
MKTKTLFLAFILMSLMVDAQVGYISTIAGTGIAGYSGNGGQATAAKLNVPFGIIIDSSGNIIFSDNGNNVIRKITASTGIITKIAGTYYPNNGSSWYYGGDGGLATSAYLANPFGVAFDSVGNIYIADNLNNVIRKITVSTGIISTVAGDGSIFFNFWPFCGDGGMATDAQLNNPWGVAVDHAGNIYIADRDNNVIRKVDASTGIINTIAGDGSANYYGDGGLAINAELYAPDGVTLDAAGNIYISDDGNNVIRKITASSGIITTVAGNGIAGYSGDNGLATSAKLNDPSLGVAFDADGNFYIADDANNVIRKVTVSTGIITTVAGCGVNGYGGDGGPATSALLNGPEGVAVDALGNIYITDENHTIRKVNGPGGTAPATPAAILGNATVCYGSTNTYSVASVSGATSYTWTLPGGWSGTSTTETINATAGASGTITVTANNAFGSSAPQTLSVTVTTVNTSVIQAGSTLTANAVGAGYQWLDCNGYIPLSGETSQSFTADSSGSYAVIITQGGCSDTSDCYQVYIGGVPPKPGDITGNTTVCYGSDNTYSITPVSGATSYTWTLPGGWSGYSNSESITTTAFSSGTISVTANNTYGSSAPQILYVTVITVNTSVTQTGSTLTADAIGAAYQWVDCNNWFLPIPGQTFQSFTATTPGSYAVIITQDGCIDTSACFTTSEGCNITITGADLPYDGLSVLLSVDTTTNVSLGTPGTSQVWDYSALLLHYPKYADYHATSTTAYATIFPYSNIYTYGPGNLYGSLFGGAPVGPGNGYCFWRSDSSGFWVTGFRPESGLCAGIDVQNAPQELVIGAPATFGSLFSAYGRWELPFDNVPTDVDTFYVRTIKKQIVADACGSLTTPYGTFPNVLREHEYITEIDSIYGKLYGFQVYATEYLRDSTNTYSYIANGIGYPVCIVHCDKNNVVKNVEYYSGTFSGVIPKPETKTQYLVYPNPSDGIITLEITNGNSNIDNQISIYNLVGNVVWQKSTSDAITRIDMGGFSKGIYFVKIQSGEDIHTEKVVIQ